MKLRLSAVLLAGVILSLAAPAILAAQNDESSPSKADDAARQTEISSSKASPKRDDDCENSASRTKWLMQRDLGAGSVEESEATSTGTP